MPYKRFSLADIPPSLKKDNHQITADFINEMIRQSFNDTPLTVVEKKIPGYDYTYYGDKNKVFLKCSSVKDIVSVTVSNLKGADITYTAELSTGYYQNYIIISRDLLDGEELNVRYIANPAESDFITKNRDQVYLNEEIYKALINKLHTYAKACEEILNSKK